MRAWRVTIAGLMGVVLLSAVGLMGLRTGSLVWASAAFSISVLALLAASVTAALARGRRQAFALGFAVFGWVYVSLNLGPLSLHRLDAPPLILAPAWDALCARLHPVQNVQTGAVWRDASQPSLMVGDLSMRGRIALFNANSIRVYSDPSDDSNMIQSWPGNPVHFEQTGHALGALFVALLGGLWGLREHHRRERAAMAASRSQESQGRP